jgi:hypothetical protein
MGRPKGAENKDKPFRDALRIEVASAEKGQKSVAHKGSLRHVARQLLIRAGEETIACREVADRLDGKVAQAIVGDNEHAPVRFIIEGAPD